MEESIANFRKQRRAWSSMHGMKGGQRIRVVDITPDGTRVKVKTKATRMTFAMEQNASRARKPSRRRCVPYAVS